jgi:hypothetical protein
MFDAGTLIFLRSFTWQTLLAEHQPVQLRLGEYYPSVGPCSIVSYVST